MTQIQMWTWGTAALATAGVIVRPFGWPEAVWAVAGALVLVATGLLPVADALKGIGKGTDVYLFLTGMMLLSEVARQEGLFDWLAAVATKRANGSPQRLFLLIYLVGTVVTVFLSNDAAAVVLTPAVAAAVKTAKAKDPLTYLFICAFIANAASFVLPISNPANLVIYGSPYAAAAAMAAALRAAVGSGPFAATYFGFAPGRSAVDASSRTISRPTSRCRRCRAPAERWQLCRHPHDGDRAAGLLRLRHPAGSGRPLPGGAGHRDPRC